MATVADMQRRLERIEQSKSKGPEFGVYESTDYTYDEFQAIEERPGVIKIEIVEGDRDQPDAVFYKDGPRYTATA
jgi:hypothetical protein